MDKKGIYLISGIVATVLFCIFSTELYEGMFTAPGFSDAMYNHSIYPLVATITAAMAWVGAAIYYYAINSVRFARWWHWLCVLAIVTILAPIVCYLVNSSIFDEENLSYAAEMVSFQGVNLLFAAALFVVASFSMRWWSSNCRHTPFPQ
ncbi:MAG: hypothetical protein Q4B68_07790 [Bacteroidales bacterium]|nr:hypothetical protein [Bacteroidales bacterium]